MWQNVWNSLVWSIYTIVVGLVFECRFQIFACVTNKLFRSVTFKSLFRRIIYVCLFAFMTPRFKSLFLLLFHDDLEFLKSYIDCDKLQIFGPVECFKIEISKKSSFFKFWIPWFNGSKIRKVCSSSLIFLWPKHFTFSSSFLSLICLF